MTAVARTADRTVFEIVKVDHKADDARSSARRTGHALATIGIICTTRTTLTVFKPQEK